MTDKIYIDASALKSWGCHELYRQQQVLNRAPNKPNLYYEMGTAMHLAVEAYWKGKAYHEAENEAFQHMREVPNQDLLNPFERKKWDDNIANIPDLVACYYDSIKADLNQAIMLEKEFTIPYDIKTGGANSRLHHGDNRGDGSSGNLGSDSFQVILCGRMDRVLKGPALVDVKTASEIDDYSNGEKWKAVYRKSMLMDPQFGFYDYALQHLCECGHGQPNHVINSDRDGYFCMDAGCDCYNFKSLTPKECYLEVIIKPYRSKPARLEIVRLDEVVSDAYRARFRQQLAWKVSEIVKYRTKYADQAPWPMNHAMCTTKYGQCPMLELCVWGEVPNVMNRYGQRKEHLECRKEAK